MNHLHQDDTPSKFQGQEGAREAPEWSLIRRSEQADRKLDRCEPGQLRVRASGNQEHQGSQPLLSPFPVFPCSDSPHSEPGTIDEVDHDNGTEPHTSDEGEYGEPGQGPHPRAPVWPPGLGLQPAIPAQSSFRRGGGPENSSRCMPQALMPSRSSPQSTPDLHPGQAQVQILKDKSVR